jgi:hypothetical protein
LLSEIKRTEEMETQLMSMMADERSMMQEVADNKEK